MKKRSARIKRKTSETNIDMNLNLDGTGSYAVKTSIPFIDHMISLFAKHGVFNCTVKAQGDTDIDDHHLVEDLGICLGRAVAQALGKKEKISRYGNACVPMDETLAHAVIDISGRPYLVFDVRFKKSRKDSFDFELIEDFFRAVAFNAGMTVHLRMLYGRDNHHIAEALFKAFGVALSQAVAINPRRAGIPSTKGRI
ncbi:MAG: imidazoleglycerol-phosphate dehydratase HisB [Elusimicrobia bacterium]|nr:imidazoleglycerol-phosphate dehydratase HisB [Elusimicrobiota bacterium]MBD3411905.1 imidazoleglycerol-phosphate dehydratase HisB [Elusimicrobiota bacterium]